MDKEFFDLVFESLQEDLSNELTGKANSKQELREDIFTAEILKKANNDILQCANLRTDLLNRFLSIISTLNRYSSQIGHGKQRNLEVCQRYEIAIKRRMQSQCNGAEKRLRELVFEIIGEYGKSSARVKKREQYLKQTGRIKVIMTVWRLRWSRFTLRLKFDLMSSLKISHEYHRLARYYLEDLLIVKLVHGEENKKEIEAVMVKLSKRMGLICDQDLKIYSIIKVSINPTSRYFNDLLTPKEVTKLSQSSSFPYNIQMSTTVNELHNIELTLTDWLKNNILADAQNIIKRKHPIDRQPGNPQEPRLKTDRKNIMWCEVVSTGLIQWLQPSSYHPDRWNYLSKQFYNSNYVDEKQDVEQVTNGGEATDQFSQKVLKFTQNYHGQHSSVLFNDRIYFCLEERQLADALLSTNQSKGIYGLNGKEEGESVGRKENSFTLDLLHSLQELYVDFNPDESETDDKKCDVLPNDYMAVEKKLLKLREILRGPLTIKKFLKSHRERTSFHELSRKYKGLLSALEGFPDIIEVRTIDGKLLHFAPAMVGNLLESYDWRSLIACWKSKIKDDDNSYLPSSLREAANRYLPPVLPVFNSNKTGYPVLLTQFFNISQFRAPLQQETVLRMGKSPDDPNVRENSILNMDFEKRVYGEKVGTIPESPVKKKFFLENNKDSDEEQNKLSIMFLPFPPETINELLIQYFCQENPLTHPSSVPGIPKDPVSRAITPAKNSQIRLNCFSVLPDHARLRTQQSNDNLSNVGMSCSNVDLPCPTEKLNYNYILLPDASAVVESNSGQQSAGSSRSSLVSQSGNSRIPTFPCFYFLQVRKEDQQDFLNGRLQKSKSQRDVEKIEKNEEDEDDDDYSEDSEFYENEEEVDKNRDFLSAEREMTGSFQEDDELLRGLITQDYEINHKINTRVEIKKPENTLLKPAPQNQNPTKPKPNEPTTKPKKPEIPLSRRKSAGAEISEQVEVEVEEASVSGRGTTASRKQWDPAVLSNICRWRSCLCDSRGNTEMKGGSIIPIKEFICVYHAELKRFLDKKTPGSRQTTQESSKYLPKKIPNFPTTGMSEHKKDLMTIRAASSLLQELWDGKLKATVKSFSKKISRDLSFRGFLEYSSSVLINSNPPIFQLPNKNMAKIAKLNSFQRAFLEIPESFSKDSPVPMPPTWSIWKNNKHYEKTLSGQDTSIAKLDYILMKEKEISWEIKQFSGLNVFPSTELVQIRKEVKNFKDYQENLLMKVSNDSEEDRDKMDSSSKNSKNRKNAVKEIEQIVDFLNTGYEDLISILNMESKLCERKLLILNGKREEEEAQRAVFMKKLARAKAIEESQARDPANFRNQTTF